MKELRKGESFRTKDFTLIVFTGFKDNNIYCFDEYEFNEYAEDFNIYKTDRFLTAREVNELTEV